MKMMRKGIIKTVFVGVCCSIVALLVLFVGGKAERTKAYAAELLPATSIQDAYMLGEEFTLPAAEISYGGEKYPASGVIVFPDGNYHKETSCVFSQLGKYTLVYTATVDGKKIEQTKEFFVRQNLYEVSSASSVLEFTDELTLSTDKVKEGIHVALADGDIFRYNQPIDLMGNHGNRFEFFTFYPYGASDIAGDGKSVEVESFIVTLTDCYDESNYIEFEISYTSNNAGSYYPYYLAGSAKQVRGGLEVSPMTPVSGNRKEVFIDNARYIAKFGDDFGVTAGAKDADNLPCTLSFDCSRNMLYVEDNQLRLVNDFDNADIYDTAKLFKGFTTGEVYLSVRGENYLGRSMRFDVERIDGKSAQDLKNTVIQDVKAPVVQVERNGANAPIFIAKGEEVSIFQATAYDVNLVGEVEAIVYYNYGTDMQTQVALKDGKFTPNALGAYTVAYIATDRQGNVGTECVTLNCIQADGGKAVSLNVEQADSLQAGIEYTLPEHAITGINDGVWLNVFAVYEGDWENPTPIDPTTRAFCPLNIGNYEIVYYYGDAIHQYTWSYAVACAQSDAVRFLEVPELPKYFIKNASYSLPKLYAYTFKETTPKQNAAQLYVSKDSDEYQAIDGAAFKVEAENTLRFKYVYEGIEYVTEALPVVDVNFGGNLKMQEYFLGDFTKNADMKGVTYLANSTTGNATMDYVLPVSLSTFLLQFEIPQSASNFTAVDIQLIDYANQANTIHIRYGNEGLKTKWSVGAEKNMTLTKNFAGGHKVFYVKDSQMFAEDSGANFTYPVAFETDKILLRITLEGMYGQSGIMVKYVNNQPFNAMEEDFIKPSINVASPAGWYEMNASVTVSPMTALDVLSPILDSSMTVSVFAPDKTAVRAKDGTVLEKATALTAYEITLTQYGKYVVRYAAVDQNGNKYELQCNVYVSDSEKPTLTIADGYGEKTVFAVEQGESVTVMGYTVTDNLSAAENITVSVYVLNPHGGLSEVKNGQFVASIRGKWQVCYYACDEVGNTQLRYYTVLVE